MADEVVYVGSSGGDLYALDARSGSAAWTARVGSAVGGAPLVTAHHVVFLDRANRIHAVDRGTGEVRWRVDGGPDVPLEWGLEGWDYLLASPVLADSTIIVGTGDGVVYGIRLDNGEVLWHFNTGGRVRSSAVVHDGVAYVGSVTGVVHGLSVKDGSEVWRFETAGVEMNSAEWGFDRKQIYSSPAVVNGTLYVGSRDASLYAVDVESTDTLWTFADGTAWVISSPAVDTERVYSARSGSQKVRALDLASGDEIWSVMTGAYVFSSPRVVGSTVYIGSGDGKVYALDSTTGRERWSYKTKGAIYGTPAIWDGRLFVGSDDGFVYAFEASDGPQSHLAAFWDDDLTERSIWGSQEEHRRMIDYFDEAGYEILDAAALDSFLIARVADSAPSVVVFGMDAMPPSVASAATDDGLFASYLAAGGKVVWVGLPPLILERNEEGQITGVNRDSPGKLLGVSHEEWNADEYPMVPTVEGRRWGLNSRWVAMGGITVADSITVLATDEIGRAAMWARSFGGPHGTGFVYARMGFEDSYLDELREVSEYGILRRVAE